MKTHKTKSLFFRKYPYKVEIKCAGHRLISTYGVDLTREFCLSDRSKWNYRHYDVKTKQGLLEFIIVYEPFLDSDLKKRQEGDTLSYYLEDKESFDETVNHFGKWVRSVTAPAVDTDLEKLFSKNFISVCDKLPHNGFQYKIQLRSKMTATQREKFYIWLENYTDNIILSGRTKYWLSGSHYWCEPFIYVRDQRTLVMMQLFLGDNVRRTHEFVLRDTAINTVLEDELCQP